MSELDDRFAYLAEKNKLIELAKHYGSDVFKISDQSGLTVKQISIKLRNWGYQDLISETTPTRSTPYINPHYIYGPDWDQIE